MSQDLFDRLSLYGWGPIGPAIAAAMMSWHPILLLGIQGENKTEGCRVLAEAILGDGCNYQEYAAPLITPEMLLGYMDMKAYSEGRVEYIESENTVWKAEACIIDEPNRAAETIAGKIMEFIRTKKIAGRRTAVKYIFSGANPPKLFSSFFMDPAFASRFLIVQPPDDKDQEVLRKVLKLRRHGKRPMPAPAAKVEFREGIRAARKVKLSDAELAGAEQTILRIAKDVQSPSMQGQYVIGKRQWADAYASLVNLMKLNKTLYAEEPITEEQMALALIGHIPEAHGVLRRQVDPQPLKELIMLALKGLRVIDGTSIADHMRKPPSIEEQPHWAGVIVEKIAGEERSSMVRKVARHVARWLKADKIEAPVANSVLTACVHRMLALEPRVVDNAKVGADRADLAQALLKELLEVTK